MYTPGSPEPGDPNPDSPPPDGDQNIDDIDNSGDDDEG
jgi:hypothetical protein